MTLPYQQFPAEVCERMRRDGGPVFPAHANTGDRRPDRGLSVNENATRALISMMARSKLLQSEAGYIDARPLTASSAKPLATHGRNHTSGSIRESPARNWASPLCPQEKTSPARLSV